MKKRDCEVYVNYRHRSAKLESIPLACHQFYDTYLGDSDMCKKCDLYIRRESICALGNFRFDIEDGECKDFRPI